MTNAERIRSCFKENGDVEPSDIEWLIEQAERIPELERNIKLLEGQKGIKTALNNEAIKIIEEKEQENEQLREALKEVFELAKHDNQSRYLDKCYVVARQALKDVE